MASTNKTTNILLSQFLGTDHFSFLTDYNGDMLKIDTYCGNLKALTDANTAKAEQNTGSIEEMESSITAIQRVQETQNTNITNLQSTVSSDHETLTQTVKDVDNNTKDINTLKLGANTRNVTKYSNVLQRIPEKLADIQIIDNRPNGTVSIFSDGTDVLFTFKESRIRYYAKVPVTQLGETFVRNMNSLVILPCGTVSGTYNLEIDGTAIDIPWCVPLKASFQIKSGELEIEIMSNEVIPTNALFNTNPVNVQIGCDCIPI